MTSILLIEPNKQLRDNIALNLTTTGGYQVVSFPAFTNIPVLNADLVMLPAKEVTALQQSLFANLPYILTTSGDVVGQCLGKVLVQQMPMQAIAEKVRKLL